MEIYLDHNANTPIDPRVAAKVSEYLEREVGNPSSIHRFGKQSRQYIARAREIISSYLKVRSEEIIFTSGGTEGANMVIRGLFDAKREGHILTSNLEHSCVFKTVKEMEKRGAAATFLAPGAWGAVKPEAVAAALRPDTRLIALMAVNNETGVLTDIEGVARVAKEANIPLFVDGVAWLGRDQVTLFDGISAMAFSGQKIHAPQGVGFSYIKKNLSLSPLITGSTQQSGRRAGTENVPGIVGLGEAIRLLRETLPEAMRGMLRLRERFEGGLIKQIPDVKVNGEGPRCVSTSNLYFPGIDGETLLFALDLEGVASSHGSACASGVLEPSRVLANMGFPMERVKSSLRFSISRMTTEVEIDRAIAVIVQVVQKLRAHVRSRLHGRIT